MKRTAALIFLVGACQPTFHSDLRPTQQHRPRASASASPLHSVRRADPTRLRLLRTVVEKINDRYVDRNHFDFPELLLAGLNALPHAAPSVFVLHEAGAATFDVRVKDAQQTFHLDDVSSPWSLVARLEEVFRVLDAQIDPDEDVDLRDVEFAVARAVVAALDPHSSLLPPDQDAAHDPSSTAGVGLFLSNRNGQLTIMRLFQNAPGAQAGLKPMDRIAAIDGEAVAHLRPEEAVTRLRGAVGSHVVLDIVREGPQGWSQPKRFDIQRALIIRETVVSRLLSDRIGYLRLDSLQSTTCDDVTAELTKLKKSNLTGLVLDLRDNSGGLLAQAICVADAFVESGKLATVMTNNKAETEVKTAHAGHNEPTYPIIVLQDSETAAGAEILASALKGNDRALILGTRSFGNATVQALYSYDDNRWAVKLTIADVLGPDERSFQGVGIIPDIEALPIPFTNNEVERRLRFRTRESDLPTHRRSMRAQQGEQPAHVIHYFATAPARDAAETTALAEFGDGEHKEDFLIRFARDLLVHAKHSGRADMLREVAPEIDRTRAREMATTEAELRKLGVDWSVGSDAGPSRVSATATTDRKDNVGVAGAPFNLTVTVHNRGAVPLYRLHATTESDHPLFQNRHLVFGKLLPGEKRSFTTELGVCEAASSTASSSKRVCRLPYTVQDRADIIRIRFDEAHGHAPDTMTIATLLQSRARAGSLRNDNALRNGGAAEGLPVPVDAYVPTRPEIELDAGSSFVTRESGLNIKGRAVDSSRVRDVTIFLEGRKVFYMSNRVGADPKQASFEAEVALHGGTNTIVVVARRDKKTRASRVYVVRRDAPDGSPMQSPPDNALRL